MSTAYERKATEMALASGKAPTSLEVATEVLAEGLEALGSPAPTNVTTNTLKLALTGIATGTEVIVTGEVNRLERYMGGTISLDASWQVIGKNTVELILEQTAFNPITINGVEVDYDDGPVSLGWVDPTAPIVTSEEISTSYDTIIYVNGTELLRKNNYTSAYYLSATQLGLPPIGPLRASVRLLIA